MICVAGLAVILCLGAVQRPTTAQTYAPPGRLVEVDGRQMHLHSSGEGGPTVVLVGGGGAFSIDWDLVQQALAKTTRVCSYDRAGLGRSDPGPADETVEQTVSDLHMLLQSAPEKAPYVLVGASIGGIYIRAYQHAYPDEVVGLVFVNSSRRVGTAVGGEMGLLWEWSEEDIRSKYPLPSSAKGAAPSQIGEPFDRLAPELQAARLWLDIRRWETGDPGVAGPESLVS
ncbi:alpha/beta hydrolase, partial [Candidatus Poribacteria bacterium]|nr:alpha/beta hydrolase [Candidatus Poribacteria bacterium]